MESEMTANRFWVFPYAQGSEGAKLLCDELGCKRILREGTTFKKKSTDVVINWGASDCPGSYDARQQGHQVHPRIRREFFKRLEGTGLTPAFAFEQDGRRRQPRLSDLLSNEAGRVRTARAS
jgi:hypothetical protein